MLDNIKGVGKALGHRKRGKSQSSSTCIPSTLPITIYHKMKTYIFPLPTTLFLPISEPTLFLFILILTFLCSFPPSIPKGKICKKY